MTYSFKKLTYVPYQLATHYNTYDGIVYTTTSLNRVATDYCGGSVLVNRISNPDYKVKIARRLNATTAYDKTWGSCFSAWIAGDTRTKTAFPNRFVIGTNSARILGKTPTSFPYATDSTVADIALKRFKSKLQTHIGNVEALVPIAELRELRQTIGGSVRLTTTLFESLMDIKKSRGQSALKHASEAWLTWNFGFKPLIADTKAIVDSINDYVARSDHTFRISSGYSQGRIQDNNVPSLMAGAFGSFVRQHGNIKHSTSYQYIGLFKFNLRSSNNYSLATHLGLNVPALISVAWELKAFSWVVDYFTTVGAFLDDAFTVTPASVYLLENRKYTCDGYSTFEHLPSNGDTTVLKSNSTSATWHYGEFSRRSLTTLPHRILRFKSADEISKGSLNKLLNLFAVFTPTLTRLNKNELRLRKGLRRLKNKKGQYYYTD